MATFHHLHAAAAAAPVAQPPSPPSTHPPLLSQNARLLTFLTSPASASQLGSLPHLGCTPLSSLEWRKGHQRMERLTWKAKEVGSPGGFSARACNEAASTRAWADGTGSELRDVVIVGAGIAGLATALALHRLGVKSLVLEQSESLRATGTSIGIWENAWRALDVLGIADDLRPKFLKLSKVEFCASDGSCIASMPFKASGRDIELRGVERKALLTALAEPLPPGTIYFNAKVVNIDRSSQRGSTTIELKDGSAIQTKILIGCDGIRSVVGKWMGFQDPRFVGYNGIRGVGQFPDGHNFKPVMKQILGKGIRVGLIPMDANKIYWFLAVNGPSGPRIADPELIRKEALDLLQGWPDEIIEAIENSPSETLSRSALKDRWLWPFGVPSMVNGGITLAGDALHPITPNLGQGGCCALEDAVVLSHELSKAIRNIHIEQDFKTSQENFHINGSSLDMNYIEFALKAYTKKRWPRWFILSIQSFLTGAVLQWDIQLLCTLRNNILPKILHADVVLNHTLYDCGKL